MIEHFQITLSAKSRGFHLITREILSQVRELPVNGMLQVFIQHTSAGICINENADPTVLSDFEMAFNKIVPEKIWPYEHLEEGWDDMPAHVKSVLCGSHVHIPIINGKLALGVWQGIYLCEFRNHGGPRKLVVSILH